jgi:hypothetical protein
MDKDDANLKVRLIAAIEIINRGLGKPVDVSFIATIDAGINQD